MKTTSVRMGWVLAASLILVGCASAPESNTEIDQARAELDALKNDPRVQAHAPAAILDAEQALEAAQDAHEAGENDVLDHALYLAQRNMEIARVRAQRGSVEQDINRLAEERDRLALEARESQLSQQQSALEEERARARELESELAALEARRTSRGMLVTLDDVLFQTDSATIAPGATPMVDKVAEFLSENDDQRIIVEGHTDSVGAADYNRQLSEQRAEAVKDLIVARGVEPDRIVTRGYGESRPIASNDNPGGRQLNRRVEIVFPDTAD